MVVVRFILYAEQQEIASRRLTVVPARDEHVALSDRLFVVIRRSWHIEDDGDVTATVELAPLPTL